MITGSNRWASGLTRRDKRNSRPLATWAIVFLVTFLAARFMLPVGDGTPSAQPAWAWVLTMLPIAAGSVLAWYYLRFIREADEMIRRIHVEALAVGFGAAFIVGMGGGLLAQLGVPDAEELTWSVMLAAFAVKLRLAQREYDA